MEEQGELDSWYRLRMQDDHSDEQQIRTIAGAPESVIEGETVAYYHR